MGVLGEPGFHKEVFGIVLTALFLTAFEIGFFVWKVAPTISDNVGKLVDVFAAEVAKKYPQLPQAPPEVVDAVVEEEADLLAKLHQSIIFDAMWVGGVLIGVLAMLAYSLKGTGVAPLDKSGILFIAGSLILFVVFQIFFFFEVSMAYGYPGTLESTAAATEAMLKAVQKERATRTQKKSIPDFDKIKRFVVR